MLPRLSYVLSLPACLFPVLAAADRLHLANGEVLDVDRWREVGDQVVYERFGGEIAIAKTEVLRIERTAEPATTGAGRPGVVPRDAWTCPLTHPIKGNFTTASGERCLFHVPGGEYYARTKPERCYTSEVEAQRDGCRASRR